MSLDCDCTNLVDHVFIERMVEAVSHLHERIFSECHQEKIDTFIQCQNAIIEAIQIEVNSYKQKENK